MGFFSDMFENKNSNNINHEEFQNIIKNNKNTLVLDVRTIEEFRSGHIPNAKNIPVQELSTKISNLDNYKNNDIIVYCRSGVRSSKAADILNKNGFNKVYNLGGIGNYKGKLNNL
ncbi:rhodanese-like domain-containing protein [Intestinibacter sp.]|uniref:rhodanese-like domain-containing protein n=1 Tax=Intestinibacter sp. TaxID=1965304 RepID=UPI002A910EAE|nr:rhodanese-like domain-containing protein [Intestinibacter sp.]MDY5210996.1 rhodanese-like domain-containing protein [Intestinibacter sp.]